MMRVRQAIARIGWAISPYQLVGRELTSEPGVVLGAPHTSNWDFIAFLGVSWYYRVPLKVLVKKSWMRGPLWAIGKALGAVAVDRAHPGQVVDHLVAQAEQGHSFKLVIAPKGTRSPRQYWKSGFYRIALGAGLPVTLAGIDAGRRQVEVGPTIRLTGDVHADMDRIRAFYDRFDGVHPQLRSDPRLREEDS